VQQVARPKRRRRRRNSRFKPSARPERNVCAAPLHVSGPTGSISAFALALKMMHHPISQVSLSSTSSVISSGEFFAPVPLPPKVTSHGVVFSLAEKSLLEKAERNEKYAGLAARKEALELLIKEKNDELKRLCVQEAELTGSLPLETPLEPGELPPTFRRRMGTAFTIPENLIDNLKCNEVRS